MNLELETCDSHRTDLDGPSLYTKNNIERSAVLTQLVPNEYQQCREDLVRNCEITYQKEDRHWMYREQFLSDMTTWSISIRLKWTR